MSIRKIAVVGGFAVGAAVAFAPLAAADPTDITSTVDTEITSLNSLFTAEADLAGVPSGDIEGGTTAGTFEFINPMDVATVAPHLTNVADASQVTPLEFELYGVDPIAAGISSDSGAFDVFNGALGEFDDAANVGLFALENGGAAITASDASENLIQTGATTAALATDSVSGEFSTFFDAGLGDLSGFFDIPSL
jgi:hypothetical protein